MTNNFEKILQNKFSNHKVDPPDYVFTEVRKHYPNKSFIDIVKNPKSLSLIIGGLIIVGIVSVLVLNNSINKTQKYKPEEFKQNTITNNTSEKINTNNQIKEPINHTSLINKQESVINQESNRLREPANFFSINDTMVCGNTLVLNANIDEDYLSANCDLSITKNAHNEIVVCCIENEKCQLYYTSTEGNTIYCDTMSIRFNNTTKPKFEIVREINCPNEPLLVKLSTDSGNNISWDIPNAEIREFNNEYYNIKWNDYNGDTALITVIIEQNGCVHTIESKSYLPPAPNITISTTGETCNNSNAIISVTPSEADTYEYFLNNISSKNGTFSGLKAGNYNLKVSYNNNCEYIENVEIASTGIINADFDIEYDAIDKRRVHLLNKTRIDNLNYDELDNISFEWRTGTKLSYESNPYFVLDNELDKDISLTVKYGDDCTTTMTKTINYTDEFIKAPNIFSPDGDGISDKFIVKIGATSSFEAVITNTRGEIIYKWTDPYSGWDGRINGGNLASEGVYYYIIKAVKPDGSIIEKKGMLQLVRN